MPPCAFQEDFLECKRQRLEGLLAAAGLALKMLAVDRGLLSPAGGSCLAHTCRLRKTAARPFSDGPPSRAHSGLLGFCCLSQLPTVLLASPA